MHNLSIAATSMTPAIEADWTSGHLSLSGDSYPENSFDFFQPLIVWLESYLQQGKGPLVVEVGLTYLNTSSVRVMMDVLDMLEENYRMGRAVSFTWYYEAGNERVAGLAEDFREDCSFPFAIQPR